MVRGQCPMLKSHYVAPIALNVDFYTCELDPLQIQMERNDPQIKFTCSPDCGDAYERCPRYQQR